MLGALFYDYGAAARVCARPGRAIFDGGKFSREELDFVNPGIPVLGLLTEFSGRDLVLLVGCRGSIRISSCVFGPVPPFLSSLTLSA